MHHGQGPGFLSLNLEAITLPENPDHLQIAQEADLLASDFACNLQEWKLLLQLHLFLLLVLLSLRGEQGP